MQIARADIAGPSSGFSNVSVACAQDTTLLDDGFLVDENGNTPQQGLHVRGSYPSDGSPTATPVADGTVNPAFWTATIQPGGMAPGATNSHVFALCAVAAASADVPEVPWPAALPGSAALTLLAGTVTRRRRLRKSS